MTNSDQFLLVHRVVYESDDRRIVPCGKKNPEIQKDFGFPCLIQLYMKVHRSTRSATQLLSGLSDGYAADAHSPGTWLLRKDV